MKEKERIDFANTLRGFAAICVVIAHYYGVFWLNRAAASAITYTPELPLNSFAVPKYIQWINSVNLFNWGAYGVALFFLISGFVIPFSLKKSSFISFFVNRVARILPTYIIGFSITLISIWFAIKYFSGSWPFTMREIFIHYIPGIRDILWSRNIDGIIWTLEIEMKFYFICMLAIHLFRNGSKKVFFIPIFLFIISIALLNKIDIWASAAPSLYSKAYTFTFISQFITFMFIGVTFHYLQVGLLTSEKTIVIILGLFIAFSTQWQLGVFKISVSQIWNYGLALFTFATAFTYQNLFKPNKILDFFADISYPLYVVHGVAGYILIRVLLDCGLKAWVSLLITTLTAVFVSWIIHILIESPLQIIGKSILKK